MNKESEIVKVETRAGYFAECLVEGSTEDTKCGKKIKRRALATSIVLQTAGLGALVIAPMLAKPAEIRPTTAVPIPPYNPIRPVHSETQILADPPRPVCVVCTRFLVRPNTLISGRREAPSSGGDRILDGALPVPAGARSGPELFAAAKQPKRPDDPSHDVRRIHEPSISPALLVNRVEPVFPAILRQLHRNGRVELRALIATNGTIQSLEVVSGDPLCVQSALDAVRQWRYKPTLLNGEPVEVDTSITVIYMVNQQ
jgi:protein TonB